MSKTILSIQSHVSYGYVGNRAATFPLQRLGFDVIAVHTVQFSNHTGYGSWTGEVFSPNHIQEILDGVQIRSPKVDAILSGYLGDPAIGEIIMNALDDFECDMWLCDPVMGDVGRGFFVKEGIPEFFTNTAVQRARIMTPNQFELNAMTGMDINSPAEALHACNLLHNKGVQTIVLTSFEHDALAKDKIAMLVSDKNGERYIVETPKLDLTPPPNGAGDMTSALILGHILNGAHLRQALERTANNVFDVFTKTKKRGERELAIIEAQEAFVITDCPYKARVIEAG